MSEITLTAEARKTIQKALKFFSKEEFLAIVDEVFARQAPIVAGRIVKRKLSGDPLHRRTGQLARSVLGVGTRVGGVPAIRIGIVRQYGAARYAGIQEYGTKGINPDSPYNTIKPKKAKSLAIPVGKATTRAGVSRYGSPRNYPGELHFRPKKRSNPNPHSIGGLFNEQGDLLYWLMSQVDIKPKWYLRDGLTENLPAILEALKKRLEKSLA